MSKQHVPLIAAIHIDVNRPLIMNSGSLARGNVFLRRLPGTFFVQEADILTWAFPRTGKSNPHFSQFCMPERLKKVKPKSLRIMSATFFPKQFFSSQKSREQRG